MTPVSPTVHYTTLYYVLDCTILYCTVLYCTALYCTALALYCTVLQVDEQIDKHTGLQASAEHLTWSYANILHALHIRK